MRNEWEKCSRCGTIKAFTCKDCGKRIHPYYSGTLSGGGIAPWWHDDEDEIHCDEGVLHHPISEDIPDVKEN